MNIEELIKHLQEYPKELEVPRAISIQKTIDVLNDAFNQQRALEAIPVAFRKWYEVDLRCLCITETVKIVCICRYCRKDYKTTHDIECPVGELEKISITPTADFTSLEYA